MRNVHDDLNIYDIEPENLIAYQDIITYFIIILSLVIIFYKRQYY